VADSDAITAEIPIPQRRIGQTLRAVVEVRNGGFLECAGQRLALFSRLVAEHSPKQLRGDSEGSSFLEEPNAANDRFPDPLHADITPKTLALNEGVLPGVRVAIVHDFLYVYAGAERVLEQIIRLFPQADLFSLFDFLPDHLRGFINGKTVQTSFLQKLPLARRMHRAFLPLMPLAIEQLDVSSYDIVISSSYTVAKGVLTRPDQLHICYCHTPVRFAWDLQHLDFGKATGLLHFCKKTLARLLLHYIRNWDVQSSNCVDVFLTNSDAVGRRVRKIYRRNAITIYPPVNTDWFSLNDQKENFYVTASRLVPYKRIDLIIETFARMPQRQLVVVGAGPEWERLLLKATDNIRLVGHQSAEQLRHYLQRARAFVFAAEEDFGIAPVEAQACGTPVIAFGRGGVRETVIPEQTGLLFDEQTPESLQDAINTFESMTWDYSLIRQNAERFSIRQFRKQFSDITKGAWKSFHATNRSADARQSGLVEILEDAATSLGDDVGEIAIPNLKK
jgi:glycosyltransferase involved in cell wall biosynthesis